MPERRARLMKSTITSESLTATPIRPIVAYIIGKLTLYPRSATPPMTPIRPKGIAVTTISGWT